MSTPWLDAEDLLMLLGEHTGAYAKVRVGGILFAVAQRPRAVLVGHTIYPTALDQAAALLHGVFCWRPLDIWNSGVGWAAAESHLLYRALVLDMSPKLRMELTNRLMTGEIDSVDELTLALAPTSSPPCRSDG